MPVVYNLNQIIGALTTSWGGSGQGQTRTWNDFTIEYSLPDTVPTRADGEQTGFRAMTSTEKSYARWAFTMWDDLIAPSLTEVNNTDAQITIGMSSSTSNGGTYTSPFLVAQPPGSSTFDREIERQRVWLNTGWTDFQAANYQYGERGMETMIHEIGHALGLSHPGAYNATDSTPPTYAANAVYTQDTLQYTIMSYFNAGADGTSVDRTGTSQTRDANNDGVNAMSPLLHDILAIQAKYGADMTTRAGNDVYGFNCSLSSGWRPAYDFGWLYNPNPVIAIWDAGGFDRLDCSGYADNQVIDLAPGSFSDVGALTKNVAIAYNVIIEDAAGGSGNDHIKGNHVANHLWGNDGFDILEGFDGNDILDAGFTAGGSQMYGGNQNDDMWAGPGTDYIDGGNDSDTVVYALSNDGIIIDTTIGKVMGGWAENDTLVSVENITASAFDDSIRLGAENNRVIAGAGSDDVATGSGNDVIYGEAGNDQLFGGDGADWLDGGIDFDTAVFGAASTINLATGVHGGEAAGDTFIGIERFITGDGADVMVANDFAAANFISGDGADSMYGGVWDDYFRGGKGADYISGGGGSDTVSYADASNAITADLSFSDGTTDGKIIAGDWGLDTLVSIENVEGTSFADLLYGDERNNRLYGLGGDDDLKGDYNGGSGADLLDGGDGNDVLDGGAGGDQLIGGRGNDTYYVDTNADQVRDFAGEGNDTVIASATFVLHSTLAEVETLMTNDAASTAAIGLYGSDFGNTIIGNAGANTLSGRGGNDFLYTGAGADVMDGGDGYDTMVFSRSMVADWQSGVLDLEIGQDSWLNWEAIQGASGDDRIRTNSWGFSIELRGGAGNDVLATGPFGFVSDILKGEDGDDELDGGAGADTMIGGLGKDIFVVDNAGDVVTELLNEGSDTVRTTLLNYTLGSNVEKLEFIGTGAFTGKGNVLSNRITGGASDDKFFADSLGDDVFIGGDGIDEVSFKARGAAVIDFVTGVHGGSAIGESFGSVEVISGSDTGNDVMTSGNVGRRFYGNGGADRLTGGNGNDRLFGGNGKDVLDGGAFADNLQGGGGNDTMTGGSGRDNFIYSERAFGQDSVTDFEDGVDRLWFEARVADAISDFTITGNNSATVTVTLTALPANSVTLQSAGGAINLSASDFVFV